jgi:hypothetical protein
VEPVYEKRIETLDDLLNSDLVYCYSPLIHLAQDSFAYPELASFIEHKALKADSTANRSCLREMIAKRDISLISTQFYATYVAREIGLVDVAKVICPLDENIISAGLTVLFKKGNPLLDGFNILMRCYLEAGLLERLWTELQHRATLRGGGRFREAAGYVFFAFSFSHLKPAFVVLLVGTVCSSVVFIVELTVNWLCKRRERNWIRALEE